MAEYSKRFIRYHAENPGVWAMFEKFALEAAESRARFSAQMIFERMRWYTRIETKGVFKINNNYRPDYARMFIEKYPQHAGLFQLRERRIIDVALTEPVQQTFGNSYAQQ